MSERVSRLKSLDLVTTSYRNHPKEVRALHTPVLETYQALTVAQPHIEFPSLISLSMLQVCWFLDKPTAVSEIEPRLTLRRRRIYQLLEQLQSRNPTTKHDIQYVLTDDLTRLARFAQAVIKYQHQHRARTSLSTATVVWSAPMKHSSPPATRQLKPFNRPSKTKRTGT